MMDVAVAGAAWIVGSVFVALGVGALIKWSHAHPPR